MELYRNLSQLSWSILSTRKTKSEYIPSSTNLLEDISPTQKESAKKAIEWLVAKAPHTIMGIAEHFEMSAVLIAVLISELLRDNRLKVDSKNPDLVCLNDNIKRAPRVSNTPHLG
jgi:CO dehydrogenase/acetyl-CoA synthase alpha subunit